MASTVSNNISILRNIIKQVQDDSQYTDKFLFELISAAKATLIKQKLLKYGTTSIFNEHTFCIRLEEDFAHDCDCVAYGCKILKSEFPIPRAMMGRSSEELRVETLGGKLIPYKSEEQLKYEKEDDIKAGGLAWSMRSRHLIIWNNLDFISVQVTGVWEDISEWSEIHACADSDGNPTQCYDIYSEDFGLDKDMILTCYEMALKLIGISLQIKSDMTVDAQPEIKA
jgi:hypothetical protein